MRPRNLHSWAALLALAAALLTQAGDPLAAQDGRAGAQPALDSGWAWELASLEAADLIARLGLSDDQLDDLYTILSAYQRTVQQPGAKWEQELEARSADLERLATALLTPTPAEKDLQEAEEIIASRPTEEAPKEQIVEQLKDRLSPAQAALIDWREGPAEEALGTELERSPTERTGEFIYSQLAECRYVSAALYYNQKFTRANMLYQMLAPPQFTLREQQDTYSVILSIFDEARMMSDEQFDMEGAALVEDLLALFYGPESPQLEEAVGGAALDRDEVERILSHPAALWLLQQLGYGQPSE